jgi:glycosyltransferase involved in cell wall biosynthesis
MNCISSLQQSEDFKKGFELEIIIVESNREYQKEYTFPDFVTVIVPETSFGFHKFLNIGIEKAKGDFIALCNNDLIFHLNWFSTIVNVYKNHKDILSFSPIDPTKELGKFKGEYELGYKVTQQIKGWCLVCHKTMFRKIKKLDNRFQFYYSDNDYALSLLYYGIKHAVVSNSHVAHLHKVASKEGMHKKDDFFNPESLGMKIPKYLHGEGFQWILSDKRVLFDHLTYYHKWGNPNSMYRIARYSETLNNLHLNFITRLLLNIKRALKI